MKKQQQQQVCRMSEWDKQVTMMENKELLDDLALSDKAGMPDDMEQDSLVAVIKAVADGR